jgi:soluble lytic murein transglycosylase
MKKERLEPAHGGLGMIRRIACVLMLLAAPILAQAPQVPTAPFTPGVLSSTDVTRYREIIADERAGRFVQAKRLFANVDDKSLEGYVLAEHYLSPRSKRTPVKELVSWLKTYGDLPIAQRIHKLAVKRATKKVRRHHHRVTIMTTSVPYPSAAQYRGGGYEDADLPDPPIVSDAARAMIEQINADIHSDQPDLAYSTVQSLIAANSAPPSDIARLSQRVCMSYLAEGMDDKAFDLGHSMADTGRQYAPQLDWCAGLAAFRLKKFGDAAVHFETLSQVASIPNWNRGAAAFWAARSYMRAGDPSHVVTLLTFAARNQPTFYGLLAERLLGQDTQTGFADPVLLPGDFQKIIEHPAARRAVALWQIGGEERNYVNAELNRAFGNSAKLQLDAAYAALARAMDVPNLELRASETSYSRGLLLTGLFPIPQYRPLGDYTIDPALVLAFVRIETRFQANAVSPAGALGLMQLMPGTAKSLGGTSDEDQILNPAYNMSLGQRYIARLLDHYNGSLIQLAAAYNAGPGKVAAWTAARGGKEDDALMFIESMRAPETRSYVKRVLTYYWMYHRRNDAQAPSLDETARGGWPIYHAPQQSAPPPPPPPTDQDDDDDDDDAST